jgi:hypothetical protein
MYSFFADEQAIQVTAHRNFRRLTRILLRCERLVLDTDAYCYRHAADYFTR